MDTRAIIDYAMNDDAKAMRDALYASIHDRVNAHIQSQKQVIAQSIFPEEADEEFDEEVEQIDELSLQTMKSAKEKLGNKAVDAHYMDDKRSARNYAGRALQMGAKIKRKERSLSSVKEEVEELTEGKMDKMSLSGLWHKHAEHAYAADQGYGGGMGGHHSHHAATAIENHVRKHYGNKAADDMMDHSDHHVARVEYAGRDEYEHHEKEAAKLRAKHKISGDLLGPDTN